MALSESAKRAILDQMARYPTSRTALLPALHIAQQEAGYIDEEAMLEISRIFGLSPAQVEEVITFYTMFHRQPVGRHLLQVCTNISCLLRGAERLLQHLERALDLRPKETTSDGAFTLLEVECVGACELAPVVQVNYDFHGPLNIEKLDKLIEELRGR